MANLNFTSKIVFAHGSTTHQHNTPPWILPRYPTRGPSSVLTLILSLLVVSINLSMNCIGNQVVLYRGRGYSNSFIPCRGVLLHTCFHHLPPFTRHVLGNLQAEAQRGCRPRPTKTLKSLVQVYRLSRFHPQGVRPRSPHTAPNDVYRVPRRQTSARHTRPRCIYRIIAHP